MWNKGCPWMPCSSCINTRPQTQRRTTGGTETKWTKWKYLKRRRTGAGSSKEFLHKHKISEDMWMKISHRNNLNCNFGTKLRTMHLFECPLLELVCAEDDLIIIILHRKCFQHRLSRIWRVEMQKCLETIFSKFCFNGILVMLQNLHHPDLSNFEKKNVLKCTEFPDKVQLNCNKNTYKYAIRLYFLTNLISCSLMICMF